MVNLRVSFHQIIQHTDHYATQDPDIPRQNEIPENREDIVSMPGRGKGSTVHHCPLDGGKKGNCRPGSTPFSPSKPYCKAHQAYCGTCGITFMKGEGCKKKACSGGSR